MSEGELTKTLRDWRESHEFKANITIKDATEFVGTDRPTIHNFFEKINCEKLSHVMIDEMQINFSMEESDFEEIERNWVNLAGKICCKSLWIVWRSSDVNYPNTLDINSIMDNLGPEKLQMLTEIKRTTKEVGEFVIEVTRFIQKRFPCMTYLPMQGLEYRLHRGREKQLPRVVFVRAPRAEDFVFLWASDVVVAIRSWMPDSQPFTIITREETERNVLIKELGRRLGGGVAFLDSEGTLRGRPERGFLVLYEEQVTGMSFQNLILLDDAMNPYRSWSRMVWMARESMHIVTTDPLPCGHWEEPAQMGLVTCCSLRNTKKSIEKHRLLLLQLDQLAQLDESSYEEISWSNFSEEGYCAPPGAKTEGSKLELFFGPNRSGKTASLIDRLKRKAGMEGDEVVKPCEAPSMMKVGKRKAEEEFDAGDVIMKEFIEGIMKDFMIPSMKELIEGVMKTSMVSSVMKDDVDDAPSMMKAQNERTSKKQKIPSKPWLVFVDCSRWERKTYPRSLSVVHVKEMMREIFDGIEIYDVHDLIQQHGLQANYSPSPQVMEELVKKMLEKGTKEGRRLHVAFDDLPVHGYNMPGDTASLSAEWGRMLSSLESHASLASLAIAFQPYIEYAKATFDVKEFEKGLGLSFQIKVRILEGCHDVGFPSLIRYVLAHESPWELRVRPGTLNTRPRPSSLVFGEKPVLATPPSGLHYHGGWKCVGGRGRGCVAVTAAAVFRSRVAKGTRNAVVLVSDEETKQTFSEALRLMDSAIGSTGTPRIRHVEEYRGCENSVVMCVGVEDAWMVEGISRAIHTLVIVDGGASNSARSRMGLWMEMERRGLLVHRPLANASDLDFLSDDDWKALNRRSIFLKIRRSGTMDDEDARISSPEGAKRIFAMGNKDARAGMWEILENTLWVQEGCSAADVFLARSDMLIYGTGGEIRILHLEGKDPSEAPHGWDHNLRIAPSFPFIVDGTTGVGMGESLFLVGGHSNPRSGLRLDLHGGEWMPLPKVIEGRVDAALVMGDPHNILILGGRDPEKRQILSSCECLDTRQGAWSPFPLPIPLPIVGHAATIYGDHLCISGGWDGMESRGEVWRCRANEEGPWDTLPPLQLNRYFHGMTCGSAGELQVIGGIHQRKYDVSEVLSSEMLTFDEGRGWERQQDLPFKYVLKACEMK
ncbi:unnamed protein product [Darwinula stevensoni]|uniref:Uncharacterized protein n=1 Tax=Darwinula stevensoni TaxID=69355 RepID=A0A7R9AG65_9CRUS|nr:unnamed protein product [Darwinula stevensoni]CAG0903998.1 unnamed protein product [Darwinula stevensoni]